MRNFNHQNNNENDFSGHESQDDSPPTLVDVIEFDDYMDSENEEYRDDNYDDDDSLPSLVDYETPLPALHMFHYYLFRHMLNKLSLL